MFFKSIPASIPEYAVTARALLVLLLPIGCLATR
jgi:hypothetical protein